MKVYAAGGGPSNSTLVASGPPSFNPPSPSYRPKQVIACQSLYTRWKIFFVRIVESVERTYKKVPWTTRHTIRSCVSLYAVLYIFVTVPFRIAFYYNPFDPGVVHDHWTNELSAFTALDAVADLIGLYQFVRFYQLQKTIFGPRFISFDLGRTVSRTESLFQPPRMLIGASSFHTIPRGKIKWTLTSIGQSVSLKGNDTDNSHALRSTKMELLLEVVAVLPIEIFLYALGAYNALHMVRITKICRLYRLRRCLEQLANIYSDRAWMQHLSATGVDNLVRNIGLCAGLCHYVACGYMLLAHAQCGVSLEACDENVETSWAVRDRLFGASPARKYARTLYWASRTMVLLGYSDVTPVSDAETIYAVIVTLVGALFGSSLLATFLFIFRFRNARYAVFSTHVDNAREYMRSQNIPRGVRRQVIAYFTYSWNTHHSLDSEEALHLMPKHLQSKVVSTLKASRIKQVCFLVKESVEFINLLAAALTRRVYSPSDQIIEPKFNAQMFFVIRGSVMLSAFDGSNPKECQTGDFFADMCLLSPETFEEKAIAKTFCELYVLAKNKFDVAMSDYYRENEVDVRACMGATLEKHTTQLRKTKKLLGMRNRANSGRSSFGGNSTKGITQDTKALNWRLPGSAFRVHWDAVRLLAIIYIAFEVPYFSVFISKREVQHMFVDQFEFSARYFVTLLIEVLFGVDLVLRSRYLAQLDPIAMLIIEDPDLIYATYKANGFYLDLIAWLPVGMILESLSASGQQYSWMFRMFRLLRLREIPGLLWNVGDYYSLSSKVHLVISLLLGVTFMLHVVGCVWFEMAWISEVGNIGHSDEVVLGELSRSKCLQHSVLFDNCSWVTFDCYAHIGDAFPAENPDSSYQPSFAYLRSVYWAIVTLTAVGYGDIVAYSTVESLFAALWVFVGGIINFGVVGAMSSTISNAMAPHHHHIEKLNTLNSMLERMDISEKLSNEIRRFYHHEFIGRKQTYESQLLSHLPDQLCYEISSLLHSDAVKRVCLFDSASIEFLKEVTGKFRHRIYQNGDSICLEGDICREFLVLLHGSKVNVFFRTRKVPIRALHEGDSFAVMAFLLRRPHPATLVAASLVHASVMTREQFDSIQRKFDGDLNDMKEEAQVLWTEQQKNMRRIVRNLEKLKLQPHMMSTATLFYHGDTSVATTVGGGNETKASRDVNATREMLASLWNGIITCWNVYNSIFVIFRICFHSHLHFSSETDAAVWIADLCCDVCFAMDIYLRLYYFGCHDVGFENLVERREMDKQYRHSSTLKWDLLASTPIYAPFASRSLISSLCRLPRFIRCVDLWTYLDDVIVLIQQHFASHNVSAYLSPVKLMIILVLVAHYVGSIFFWISEHECEHIERCWMAHDHMLHEYHHSVVMSYAKSFYWAITTLLLVGSNEIVPRGTAGTIWTSFTCLCCTFIIGHIVGEISELILDLGKETKHYKSRIASFDGFAKEHELPDGLRKRVGFFFREQFEHTKGNDLHSTVHDLSANLRLKLMLEIFGHPISLLPFSRLLTSSQINNLALRLHSELFIPGDNILVEGTFGSRLCTLRRGLAAAFWSNSVTSVAILMEGALFGEVAFFLTGQRRLATVRATTACEVLHVTKYDWLELWTSNDDLSDIQFQKHAQHALLHWVHCRLLRYQRASLRAASKAKRLVSSRHTLTRMMRCHSLPQFGREFFDRMRQDDTSHFTPNHTQAGINFEMLQHCQQRPQYSAQLRLFHRYRAWRDRNQATVLPEQQNPKIFAISRHLNGVSQVSSPPDAVNSKKLKFNAAGSRLRQASQQALLVAKKETKTKEFIKLVQNIGKSWDFFMLLVSMYHLIITPFKVCFSYDLAELSDDVLHGWSAFEIFVDVLCLFDVGYKLWHSSGTQEGRVTVRQSGLRQVLASNPALRGDICAILPLEVLLFAKHIRVPRAYEPLIGEATRASWWTSRWILRLNRVLLASRIERLTEQLSQFLIYDQKVHVNEAFLYFMRGLSSYLTMGHLLACLWFITSHMGFHHYGTSWLTTSGMLTYIANEVPDTEEGVRVLSEKVTTFSLETVPLFRKYLRSLLFSMECISTLFYGDIVSMNPMELVAEIVITLWSIYIYGALVGAQAELLDASAKREAAFEQTLGELQHYLVQNEVPKGIKRQIKVYYARLWARRKGESEFAAVAHVSRSLYEDVVLATLKGFAVQVRAFRTLDDQFLRALLVCLHYVVCSESEEIYVIGDMDRSMYFIARGRVVVKMGSSESIRERGDFFGELALLYSISRLETCVAVTVAEMYCLNHEPYERLLLEFPEYRARNKLSWTTHASGSDRDRAVIEEALRCFQQYGQSGGRSASGSRNSVCNMPPLLSVEAIAANAGRIDAQLPHSYIYRAAMELLSRLNKVDPLEVKDLYLKSRDGARKQLKAVLGLHTARHESVDDVVHSFHSFHNSPPTPREKSLHEHQSDSLEHMEAVVAELSRPTDHQIDEAMKALETKTLHTRI
ncbi:Voltage-gated Ion Channel [Phytophthora megakarya]|uniref:Voltage-gated Ion Channel n=1 Tax=Phytophthora megakarya TaxID=4795 RepID=A0A225WDI8_9STRA|nr:Voltage-gated Ion Channel [Phytophthora megakarya]